MDSWFLLVLLGSGLIHAGASNTTTGKLLFDETGIWNRILVLHLMPTFEALMILKKGKVY